MFHLHFPGAQVTGASSEVLVRVDGAADAAVQHRPPRRAQDRSPIRARATI
jgi:hypothetical protein